MSYQTGSYVDANDLLDKIRLKCLEQGWTVNKYEAVGLGDRLHVSKGTVYINLRSTLNDSEFTNGRGDRYGIAGYLGTGYNGGLDWDDQPGNTYDTSILIGGFLYTNNGIGEFHIFTLSDTICVYCDSPLYKEQMVFGETSLGFPILSMSESIFSIRGVSQFRRFLSSFNTPTARYNSYENNQVVYGGIKYPEDNEKENDKINMCINASQIFYGENLINPLCTDLLNNSVNQLRGNSLLIATRIVYSTVVGSQTIDKDTEYLGIIEGLFVLTLSGIESYQTITYGAEEYIASYLYPDYSFPHNTFGVAALKN